MFGHARHPLPIAAYFMCHTIGHSSSCCELCLFVFTLLYVQDHETAQKLREELWKLKDNFPTSSDLRYVPMTINSVVDEYLHPALPRRPMSLTLR